MKLAQLNKLTIKSYFHNSNFKDSLQHCNNRQNMKHIHIEFYNIELSTINYGFVEDKKYKLQACKKKL